MTITKFDLCSQALVIIGANPIASFDDGSTEARVAVTLYEPTVRDELSRYRWRFSTTQQQLSRLTDVPLTGWDAAYQLPASCLTIDTVKVNGLPIDFDRFGPYVYCDTSETDEVILEGIFRTDEADWPPYFQMLVTLALAANFAMSLAGKEQMSDLIDKRAMRQAAIARNADAQARTTPAINTGGIVRRHRGRG